MGKALVWLFITFVKTKSDNIQTSPFGILFKIEPRNVVVVAQYK